jgi:hypothetical protein
MLSLSLHTKSIFFTSHYHVITNKTIGYYYHPVNAITLNLNQSDHIKRRILKTLIVNARWRVLNGLIICKMPGMSGGWSVNKLFTSVFGRKSHSHQKDVFRQSTKIIALSVSDAKFWPSFWGHFIDQILLWNFLSVDFILLKNSSFWTLKHPYYCWLTFYIIVHFLYFCSKFWMYYRFKKVVLNRGTDDFRIWHPVIWKSHLEMLPYNTLTKKGRCESKRLIITGFMAVF